MGSSKTGGVSRPPSKYYQIKVLRPDKFRRLTGVKPTIFAYMVTLLKRAEKRGSKKPDLSV